MIIGCRIMEKKLFAILVAVFLIASVSFISAADTSNDIGASHDIKVEIKWEDNNQTSERPDSVTVDLIKNGKVVDTKTLNSSNSWSATFNVQDDGSYSVKQTNNFSNYSVSTIGDEHNGFMIINTLKSDVLGTSKDNQENTTNLSAENEEIIIKNDNTTYNKTITNNNNTDENTTDNTTNTTKGSITNNSVIKKGNNITLTKKDTKIVVSEHEDSTKNVKKPKNETKNNLRNTGIPVIILVIAVFVVAFVPFKREK